MAVDEKRGPGKKAGSHGLGLSGVDPDENEALPGGTVSFGFGLELTEEVLFELEDFLDPHAGDQRLSGGGGIGEHDVFKFVATGREDGGTLADLGGIEQVEDGEVLDGQDLVHAFDAEAAFLIEEIGDMRLLESGLLGQAEAGQFACFDAVPEDPAQILLQDFELHRRSIAPGQNGAAERKFSTGRVWSFNLDRGNSQL